MKKIVLIISIFFISLISLVCYRGDLYDNVAGIPLDSVISPVSQDKKIYIFADPTKHTGDLRNGQTDGRTGANSLCQSAAASFSSLNGLTVYAFISDPIYYNIRDLVPSDYSTAPVYGIISVPYTETLISNTWNDLWNTSLDPRLLTNLQAATGVSGEWWSGSISDGLSDGDNCNNWNNGGGGYSGRTGLTGATDSSWIYYVSPLRPLTCSSLATLMCVAY